MSFSNMLEILQAKNNEKIVLVRLGVNDKIKVYKNCKIELDNFVYFLIMSLIQ